MRTCATTTIDGRYLPNPPAPFGGEISPNAEDSKPYWPPLVVPPEGAPNVLLIMLDEEAIKRIVWEYQNANDGYGLAIVMKELSENPTKASASKSQPGLPVMPDLMQALNIASADSRGTLAVVHPAAGDAQDLEQKLTPLIFEQGIAGRTHLVRLSAAEWAAAKETGQIAGGELEAGVIFIAPEPFGLRGEVWAEIEADTDQDQMRTELTAALDRFHEEWRKLDRRTHLASGSEDGITWTEYDPALGKVVRLPVNRPAPDDSEELR